MKEEYWSRFPDTYDRNQEYVVGNKLFSEITEELDKLDNLGDVLELGCGTGFYSTSIARKSRSLLATDLSDSLLEIARRRLRENRKVTVQREDCMEISASPESFDTVFMANLIHVIENPAGALQECNRVLRYNGRIIIATFTGHGMSLWEKFKMGVRFIRVWGKPPEHTHSFSPNTLGSMLRDAGFTVELSRLVGGKTKALFLIGRKEHSEK